MKTRLVLSSEAELDLFEAALRYEGERIGLGERFEADIDRLFARIQDNPRQFPIVDQPVRRALATRFPYGVYFTIGESAAVVLAVLHLHRHPIAWKNRPADR